MFFIYSKQKDFALELARHIVNNRPDFVLVKVSFSIAQNDLKTIIYLKKRKQIQGRSYLMCIICERSFYFCCPPPTLWWRNMRLVRSVFLFVCFFLCLFICLFVCPLERKLLISSELNVGLT